MYIHLVDQFVFYLVEIVQYIQDCIWHKNYFNLCAENFRKHTHSLSKTLTVPDNVRLFIVLCRSLSCIFTILRRWPDLKQVHE